MRSSILTQKRAKAPRRRLTRPEQALWALLRRNQTGIHFRRQHALGPFILDFYCAQALLAVEVDGLIHNTAGYTERDARREAYLFEQGITVIRIAASDVARDADEAAHIIWSTALDLSQRVQTVE